MDVIFGCKQGGGYDNAGARSNSGAMDCENAELIQQLLGELDVVGSGGLTFQAE
jgi:hypothetical protein